LVWAPARLATLQTVNSTVRAFATRCFTLSYAIGKEPSQDRWCPASAVSTPSCFPIDHPFAGLILRSGALTLPRL